MTFKKIASVLMAGALTLSLAMPAFASATPNPNIVSEADRLAVARATEFEVEMTGEVYTPVIRVQVLSKGAKMYINPNKGNIEGTATAFGQGATDISYKIEQLSVASTPILIRSDSDSGLEVNMTATLTKPSGVEFVAAKPDSGETTKKLFVYMQGTAKDGGNTAITDIDSAKELTNDELMGVTKKTAGAGLVGTDGKATGTSVCTIAPAKQSDGKIIPQYGAVMLAGDAAAKAQWGENDAVSATVVLTFSGSTD